MTASLEAMRSEFHAAVGSAEPGIAAANKLCAVCVGLFGVDGAAVSTVHDGAAQWTFGSSSENSRRLDEYQFTFGEGPCIDAVAEGAPVLAPNLDSPHERRWPAFAGAALDEGIHAVFALPVVLASACVGALDLFRRAPGPMSETDLAGGMIAAELASLPLLDLAATVAPPAGAATDSARAEDGEWGELAELDRVEIYQATGMLMGQLQVGDAEALLRLRGHAIATGQTASQVAWAILERRLTLERDDLPDPGKEQR